MVRVEGIEKRAESRLDRKRRVRTRGVQGYLAHKKTPPPQDHHRALGIVPLNSPKQVRFLMSDVPLYRPPSTGRTRARAPWWWGLPHGGVRPPHQKSTGLTQLTSGPYVVQIWSRNTPKFGPNETFVLHRMVNLDTHLRWC